MPITPLMRRRLETITCVATQTGAGNETGAGNVTRRTPRPSTRGSHRPPLETPRHWRTPRNRLPPQRSRRWPLKFFSHLNEEEDCSVLLKEDKNRLHPWEPLPKWAVYDQRGPSLHRRQLLGLPPNSLKLHVCRRLCRLLIRQTSRIADRSSCCESCRMNMHPSLHHQFEVPHGVLEPPAGVFLGSNLRDLHHIEAPPVWMRHSSRSG